MRVNPILSRINRRSVHAAIATGLLSACVGSGAIGSDTAPAGDAAYLAEGREIALRFKGELGSNLTRELSAGGTVPAIAFCNENAATIASRISEEAGAKVKRVSDRPRNPANRANDAELAYIEGAKATLAQSETPKPVVHDIDGRVVGYYPIVTNGMCLQCHGTPGQQVTAETAAVLKERYPLDQALGYGDGELRGIFVISMDRN